MAKMEKKKQGGLLADKKLIGIVAVGAILFAVVLYLVITSTQTVQAVVFKDDQPSGTQVTEEMVETIEVPLNTPSNFVRNPNEVVGYTLKSGVDKGQLVYVNDFMNSWESYVEDENIPEDYVITSIEVPDAHAVGGLITAGDVVDVMGVSSRGVIQSFDSAGDMNLTEKGYSNRDGEAVQVYYVLSNVKIINTNSALATAQDGEMSSVSDSSGESGSSYYIIALSYEDCKKLRQAEGVFDALWLNIAPRQNQDNDPLINQMLGQSFSDLHDAQKPIQEKDGSLTADTPEKGAGEEGSAESGSSDDAATAAPASMLGAPNAGGEGAEGAENGADATATE